MSDWYIPDQQITPYYDEDPEVCPSCKGEGFEIIEIVDEDDGEILYEKERCYMCGGEGVIFE